MHSKNIIFTLKMQNIGKTKAIKETYKTAVITLGFEPIAF